jgi:hypothetical protein
MEKKGANLKITQFNKEILKELIDIKPKAYNRAKQLFPNIDDWILGQDYPTYNELSELSKIFKVPFGYFFSTKFPEYQPPISIPNVKEHEGLIDTIKLAEKIQSWSKDILIELGWEKSDFNFSKVKIDNSDNLESLIDEIEKNGIFVSILSGVEDYAGFVLYDDIAPVIVINNRIKEKTDVLIEATKYVVDKKSRIIDRKDYNFTDDDKIHISKRFLDLIDSAVAEGIITYIDAIRITRFDDYW